MWPAVMREARKVFGPRNRFGVHAFGIGAKRARGHTRGYRTLIALVMRKQERPRDRVPAVQFSFKRRTLTVMPDVIATGQAARATKGTKIAFTGLHPGASIMVENRYAACGCLMHRGDGRPSHVLTAGHLFRVDAVGTPVFGGIGNQVKQIGTLVANLLDPNPDLPFPMDAAAVELNAAGVNLANQTAAPVRLGGVVGSDDIGGLDVQAYLATSHDFSRETTTNDEPFSFPNMQSAVRGRYEVTNVVRTDGAITLEGDSGTVLATADPSRGAAGLCIGVVGTAMSLFDPLFRARKYLSQELGFALKLWPPKPTENDDN